MNLIRPVDFQLAMVADAAGQSAFRAVLFTLPISVVLAILFPLRPPPSVAAGLLFLLSAGLSFFLVAGLNFLVGLLAIRIQVDPRDPARQVPGPRAALRAPDPDDAVSRAPAHDPPRLALSRTSTSRRRRSTSARRRGLAGRGAPGAPGRLDGPPARRRPVGLAPVAPAHHDPGRMSVAAREEPRPPRPPLRPVLRAVRQGAARVPAGLLLERLRLVPRNRGLLRFPADRLLAGPGGQGLVLRGDGLPLRLLADPARDLQRLLLEPLHVSRTAT